MPVPNSRIKIKTVENCDFISLPLAKPEYFGREKTFRLRIKWGDGSTNTYSNNYDNATLDWNRDYDTAGKTKNSVPESDTLVVPFHSYEAPGQYTIEIFGGFDYSHGESDNENIGTLKFAFAAAEDRMEISTGEGENKVVTRQCVGTPDKIEEIFGLGSANRPRGDLFIHGQGDFEDFTNLKKIRCSLKLLKSIKSSSEDKTISYSEVDSAKVCFINTFKNTESLEQTKQIQRLLSGSPQVINMEGCFDNSAYNGSLLWNTSEVKNFNRTFRKSKNLAPIKFSTSSAVSIDYMFEDSYCGRVFKIFKKLYKGTASGGTSFWKLVLTNNSGNTLWSNDGSIDIGSAVGEPSASVSLVTETDGTTKNNFTIGAGGMDPISPDAFIDPSKSNDFYTDAKLHFWTSDTDEGNYTKQSVVVLDFNSPGVIRKNVDSLIGEWTNVVSAVGTFKDHKKLDPDLLKKAFAADKEYPIETLEACFEGTNFWKSRRNYALRWARAKPKSLSRYIRNSRNAFDISRIDTSRLENVSHVCEDTDYNLGINFNFENVTDASYAFAGCTGNPKLTEAFWRRGPLRRYNFKPINAEAMFEGSTGWSGQNWDWRHMKPTSLERTFKDCDFNGRFSGINTSNCTSLNSTFKNSSFTSTDTNITKWNVKNVEDASYCFELNQGEWDLSLWFKPEKRKNFKIKNVTGFFESSKNKTVCNGWAATFAKTVVSASAMFKNNTAIKFNDIYKILTNTRKNSKIEDIDEMFRGIKLETGEPTGSQKFEMKKWHLAKPECNQHINVFRGVGITIPTVTYGRCRFKSHESRDNIVEDPIYEKKNLYAHSEVVYRTLCSREMGQQGEYDTVFMKVS